MAYCKPATTLVDTKDKLNVSSGYSYKGRAHFDNLLGALQYLIVTRPDISHIVQQVCLHMHDSKDDNIVRIYDLK